MSPRDRARELVADALGLELDDVSANATMATLARWDSLQHLAVVTALEAELGVVLSPEEITAASSIDAIAVHLEARR